MAHKRLLRSLGEVMRARRTNLGESQEAFAARIGLHRTYVGAIERGERNPSFNNLCRIAEGLSARLSALVLEAEQQADDE